VSGLWGAGRRTSTTSRRFSNIPWIITHGADEYAASAPRRVARPGFQAGGQIVNGGLAEVPMGLQPALPHLRCRAAASRTVASSRPCSSGVRPAGVCRRACSIRRSTMRAGRDRRYRRFRRHGRRSTTRLACRPARAYFLDFTQEREAAAVHSLSSGHQAQASRYSTASSPGTAVRATSAARGTRHYIIDGTLCALAARRPNPVLTTSGTPRRVRGARARQVLSGGQCKE